MTEIEEMQAQILALKEEVGGKVYIDVTFKGERVHGSLYPDGVGRSGEHIFKYVGDWREIIANMRSEYRERSETRLARTTEAMALDIIGLTYEHGECTDAMLRADFDARDVERLSGAAVERANVMADKGPFSVTVAGGANDGGTK